MLYLKGITLLTLKDSWTCRP